MSVYCDTCGTTPCVNPSFCAACREADKRLARGVRAHSGPTKHLSGAEAAKHNIMEVAVRARIRAQRVAAGEVDKVEAVDLTYADAVDCGLVAAVGNDVVQRVLASAFHGTR